MPSIDVVLGYTVVGTTLITLFGLIARKAIIAFFTDRSDLRVLDSKDKINANHLDEILRLESIVRRLSQRVSELEMMIHNCMDLEIQDSADIAELTVLIEGQCKTDCPHASPERLKAALDRLRERRASRLKRKTAQE